MSELPQVRFDDYQRYRTTARMIDAAAGGGVLDVLEVGADRRHLLGSFAARHRVRYLDQPSDAGEYGFPFMRGDEVALPFANEQFEIAVALDILDRIPQHCAAALLKEMVRVARLGVLIGGAFDTPGVGAVQLSAIAYHRRLLGFEHPRLREQIDGGLPDLGETEAALRALGCEVGSFTVGEIGLWLSMTQACIAASAYPDVAPKVQALHRLYGREVYDADISGSCYRQFMAATRGRPALDAIVSEMRGRSTSTTHAADLRQIADGIALANLRAKEAQDARSLQDSPPEGSPGSGVTGRMLHALWWPAYSVWRKLTWVPAVYRIMRRSIERAGWCAAWRPVTEAWRAGRLSGVRQLWAEQGQPLGYARWLRVADRRHVPSADAVQSWHAALPVRPIFVYVLDARDCDARAFSVTLRSLAGQLYPEWRLVVLLRAAQAVPELTGLKGAQPAIARSWDETLAACRAAEARFVSFLEPGAVVRQHALVRMVQAVTQRPGLLLLYSDQDRIDVHGVSYDPWFKPGWDPELLLGQDYLGPLAAVPVDRLPGDVALDRMSPGLLAWAVKLAASRGIPMRRAGHVREVLCHVRDATPASRLPDAESIREMLQRHLASCSVAAQVESTGPHRCRIRWPLPDPLPLVSIIVPTRNALDFVRRCVESIRSRTSYRRYEILLVDNQSDDPASLQYFQGLAAMRAARVLRYDAPFNYSAINNFAVSHAAGEVVCLLNNDTEVLSPGWLDELVSQAMRPDIGAVGAMLYYPDDTIQHAGVVLGLGGHAGHRFLQRPRGYAGPHDVLRHVQTMVAVTAACLAIRKSVYQEVGGLDEADFQVAYNDVDFCIRVTTRGYRNIWTPYAELYHFETATRGSDLAPSQRARWESECAALRRRWGDFLDSDPTATSSVI